MSEKPLEVLHLVAGDVSGGAARGALWLHRGLRHLGVDSKILTTSRNTLGDSSIISIASTRAGRFAASLRRYLDLAPALIYPRRKNMIFSYGCIGPNLVARPEFNQADVIHLHWINNGFFDIRQFPKITKPTVWTLRDMWPMTGGCHVADFVDCDRYLHRCGKCPQLGSRSQWDLSRLIWKKKRKFYTPQTVVVGISDWIAGRARKSSLLGDWDVRRIYNNIDTDVFSPMPKPEAKQALGLPEDKTIILTGATVAGLPWKGGGELTTALQRLAPEKYFLCCFGGGKPKELQKLGFEVLSLGKIDNDEKLRLAYSAADIFAAPSLLDSFGKTLAEAMACGTPVVCFDATGPREIVDHQVNGYKAVPFDPADLAQGIEWVAHAENYASLCQQARRKVEREFDSRVIARQYIDLYRELTGRSTRETVQ